MNMIDKILKNKDNRSLSLNMLLTLLIKGGAMLVSILIVPAYVAYFSNDTAYGAWITVSSVFTWVTMFDFGIGNGLRNHLVKTIAEKDTLGSKRYISSAYISVGFISLLLWMMGAVIIGFMPWNAFLKVPENVVSPGVFATYIQIVYSGVIIHFFFMLIFSICHAMQKTFLPNLITLITQILLLVYILIPNTAVLETKIIQLSGAYFVAHNLPILILTLVLFFTKLKDCRPSIRLFDKSKAKEIVNLGMRFFVIQIALIALSSSNEIYINLFYQSQDVVQYQYYHKLFYIISVFITLIQQPIWSAVTKAYHEGRFAWIKKVWRFMFVICTAVIGGCVLLALIYQPIVDIWLGKGVLTVDIFTIITFVLSTSTSAVINTANCFANGFGLLKSQMICTVLGAVLKLVLAFVFSSFINSWAMVMLASSLSMLPLLIVQPYVVNKFINSLSNKKLKEQNNVTF